MLRARRASSSRIKGYYRILWKGVDFNVEYSKARRLQEAGIEKTVAFGCRYEGHNIHVDKLYIESSSTISGELPTLAAIFKLGHLDISHLESPTTNSPGCNPGIRIWVGFGSP